MDVLVGRHARTRAVLDGQAIDHDVAAGVDSPVVTQRHRRLLGGIERDAVDRHVLKREVADETTHRTHLRLVGRRSRRMPEETGLGRDTLGDDYRPLFGDQRQVLEGTQVGRIGTVLVQVFPTRAHLQRLADEERPIRPRLKDDRRVRRGRVKSRLRRRRIRDHDAADHEEHISRAPRNRKVVRGQRLAAGGVVLAQELRPARGLVRIEKTALDRFIARVVGALEDLDRGRGIARKVGVDSLRVVEESDDFLKIRFIHQPSRLIARRKGVAGTTLRNTNVVLDAVDYENVVVIVLAQPANGIRHIAAVVADRNGAAVARPGEKSARALRAVRQGAGIRAAIEHERRAALLGGDDTAGITTVRRDRAVVHAVLQRDARAARRLAENAGRTARATFRIRDRRVVREVFKRDNDRTRRLADETTRVAVAARDGRRRVERAVLDRRIPGDLANERTNALDATHIRTDQRDVLNRGRTQIAEEADIGTSRDFQTADRVILTIERAGELLLGSIADRRPVLHGRHVDVHVQHDRLAVEGVAAVNRGLELLQLIKIGDVPCLVHGNQCGPGNRPALRRRQRRVVGDDLDRIADLRGRDRLVQRLVACPVHRGDGGRLCPKRRKREQKHRPSRDLRE